MKITEEQIPEAYLVSKEVYEKKITLKEGVDILSKANRMNRNSAADFIHNFKHLVKGKKFYRTLNAYSMEYFIKNIHNDFGRSGLTNAVQALKLHVNYYEKLQNTTMHKMRAIIEQFNQFNQVTDESADQSIIIDKFLESSPSRVDLMNIIKTQYDFQETEQVNTLIIKKRNNKIIAALKILREYKCQICGHRILKKNGEYYIEAAHIEPKRSGGTESANNILLLCPNHHKEFDWGDLTIIKHDKNLIEFNLNGIPYKIEFEKGI